MTDAEGTKDMLPDTPAKELTVAYRMELLSTWAEDLRRELFKQTAPPFEHPYKAAQWIEKKSKEARKLWEESDRLDALTKVVEIYKEHGLPVNDELDLYPGDYLPYWKETGETRTEREAPTFEETELQKLHDVTAKMERALGFPQVAIVNYVLAGERPSYYRATVTQKSERVITDPDENRGFGRMEIKLTLRHPLPSHDEWRDLLNKIKREFGTFGEKSLEERDRRLYDLVNENGGPPSPEGNRAFWKDVIEEWNELYPDDPINSWRGLHTRWRRMREKEKRPLQRSPNDFFTFESFEED